MTTSDNEWSFWLILLFLNKRGVYHSHADEKSSNLKEDFEKKRDNELRAEGRPAEKKITVRSRNC